MPCFHPIPAWRCLSHHERGSASPIVFKKPPGLSRALQIPCGQCIGCRLERSRQWAVRCLHESKAHEHNCFLTLTYSDRHLPPGNTLVLSDLQKFLKRLRKSIGPKIKFYACGEYGDLTSRPHYHLAIFGFDFPDKKPWSKNSQGDVLYTSAHLEKVWPFGRSMIGELTFESAAYIARYVMKKRTGRAAPTHYEWTDTDGVVWDRKPEFNTMSRNGGIGISWINQFHSDVYSGDFVVVNGKKCRPPRYYDGRYEIIDPEHMEVVKRDRAKRGRLHTDNNTPERLAVREAVQTARIQSLKRGVD